MFPVEIWGTVAAWFGAVGTGGGLFVAANVYRRDARLRRYEQAVMVRVHETSTPPLGVYMLNPENLVIEVHNTSEKYIYAVGGSLYRRSLFEIAAGDNLFGPRSDYTAMTDGERQQKLQQYRDVKEDWGLGRTVDRVAPGKIATIKFRIPYMPDNRLVVSFVDAQNQSWQIEESREIFSGKGPVLKFVGKRQARFMRFLKISSHLFTPPARTFRYYRERVSLKWWSLRNGQWGPGVEGWTQNTHGYAPPVPDPPAHLESPVREGDTATDPSTDPSESPDSSQNGSDVHK